VLTFGNQNYGVLLLYQKQYQNDNKARKKIEDMACYPLDCTSFVRRHVSNGRVYENTNSIAELSKTIPMAAEMPALIKFIGISELAGGLGLLLPAPLRIWPQLTVVAAAALALIMVLAMIFHIARGESASIGTNIALGILAGSIASGRLYKAPIAAS
jgi:putative oxidoreductase